MNKTWHKRSTLEVIKDLHYYYKILQEKKVRQNNEITFGDDMYNKLVFLTFNILKYNIKYLNNNTSDINKIKELALNYRNSLQKKYEKVEEETAIAANQIKKDKNFINKSARDFFAKSDAKGLNNKQYYIIHNAIYGIIIFESSKDNKITKAHLAKQISKNVRTFQQISEEDFNVIYDFISNDYNFKLLSKKIKSAKLRKNETSNFHEVLHNIEENNQYLFYLSDEILKTDDINKMCNNIINLNSKKEIINKNQKEMSIKHIIAKWATNLAYDKSKIGYINLQKFISDVENYNKNNDDIMPFDEENKRFALIYASELNKLSVAIKEHFGIELNQSDIKYKDLRNYNESDNLLSFISNIRENLKKSIDNIKAKSNFTNYDDIQLEINSLINTNNQIDIEDNEILIVQNVIENINTQENEKQAILIHNMTEIIKKDHKEITDDCLTNMEKERLIKRKYKNSDIDNIDFMLTKNKFLPELIGENAKYNPVDYYFDMRDKTTNAIYKNYIQQLSKFYETYYCDNPDFYKYGLEYLHSKIISKKNNILLIKYQERIIEIREGKSQNHNINPQKQSKER